MTQCPDIRRRHDGSIDYDFYRSKALALRSQAMWDAFKLKVPSGFKSVAAALVAVAAVLVFASTYQAPDSHNATGAGDAGTHLRLRDSEGAPTLAP